MPTPSHRPNPIGLAWALTAAGLGSTVGVADKWLLAYNAGPMPVVALRATVAAAALGLGLLLLRRSSFRIPWRDVPFFALFGLIGVAVLYIFYILAVLEIGAALATTLFYVYPAIATVLAALFLRERLTWRKALPLPITFVGCVLVSGLFSAGKVTWQPAGIAWALLSALAFAIYPVFSRYALARHSHWTVLFYSLAWGALWLDLLWLALGLLLPAGGGLSGVLPAPGPGTLPFWGALLYLALGATVGLYLADLQAIRRLEVRQVGLIGTLEPPVSAILAFLIFGERLAVLQWAGAALILSGVIWLRLEK